MMGKVVAIGLIAVALIVGAMIYYLQEYAYYSPVEAGTPAARITLVARADGTPEPIRVKDFQGIDAQSSPIRFRACFTILAPVAALAKTYVAYDNPDPLIGPKWFSCYDAKKIGAALESGKARAFLAQKNIHEGVDRVIAVFPDGRSFAWHQLNDKYKE